MGFNAVITTTLTALSSLVVARAGGPDGYAVFVATNMILFVSSVIAVAGLPLVLAKHAAKDEEARNFSRFRGRASSALCLAMLMGGLVGLLLAAVLGPLQRMFDLDIGPGFGVMLPLLLVLAVASDAGQGIFSGLLRPKPMMAIAISGPACMFVYLLIWRSIPDLPLWGAVAISYATSGLVALALLMSKGMLLPKVHLRELRELRELRSDLLPAAAYTYFTTFSTWSDRGIVGLLLGPTPMGWYTAAAVIVQVALRLPTHVAYLLVPTSARVDASIESHATLRRRSVEAFAVFSVAAAVAIGIAPLEIMRTMFGPGFSRAADALVILAPSLLAAAVTIPFLSTLTGTSRSGATVYLLLFTTVPRFALIVVFTMTWGFVGTAVATVSSDMLLALACLVAAPRLGRPIPLGALAKPVGVGALALVIGQTAKYGGLHSIASAVVGLVVMTPMVVNVARRSASLGKEVSSPEGFTTP